jgi:hypothetical protein
MAFAARPRCATTALLLTAAGWSGPPARHVRGMVEVQAPSLTAPRRGVHRATALASVRASVPHLAEQRPGGVMARTVREGETGPLSWALPCDLLEADQIYE